MKNKVITVNATSLVGAEMPRLDRVRYARAMIDMRCASVGYLMYRTYYESVSCDRCKAHRETNKSRVSA